MAVLLRERSSLLPFPFEPQKVADKLWASWRTARLIVAHASRYGGVVNLNLTARLFYESLFDPTTLVNRLAGYETTEDHKILLGSSPVKNVLNAPPKDQFVSDLVHAMTQEVPFDRAYFPGAFEAISSMVNHGPVRIWTSGDVAGVPQMKLSGSREQLKRLARGGWARFRREHSKPAFDVVAHEDKFRYLSDVISAFHQQEVGAIVVVDDKIDNLLQAKKRIEEVDSRRLPVILVWDRECEGSDISKPKLPKGFIGTAEEVVAQHGLVAVRSINDIVGAVMPRVGENRKIGWIVDHDDVISSDKKRVELQQEAVVNWLATSKLFQSFPEKAKIA